MNLRAIIASKGGPPDRLLIDAQTESASSVDAVMAEMKLQEDERQIRETVHRKIRNMAF
jgi:hypothetical protein